MKTIHRSLNEQDIRELRMAMLPSYILPFVISIMLGLALLAYLLIEDRLSRDELVLISILVVILGIVIHFLMSRKYREDIRNGQKKGRVLEVLGKVSKTRYKYHSSYISVLILGRKSSQFFWLKTEDGQYIVGQELYDKCNEGDTIVVYYGPSSLYKTSLEKWDKQM